MRPRLNTSAISSKENYYPVKPLITHHSFKSVDTFEYLGSNIASIEKRFVSICIAMERP